VEIGDFVQWTSQGMDMFPVPRKVTGLSDCGKFAFVEGEKTGLPVDQLTIMGDAWEGAPVATG
jgi:hypothetical protein